MSDPLVFLFDRPACCVGVCAFASSCEVKAAPRGVGRTGGGESRSGAVAMDVLSEVLSAVRLTGAIFFEWRLSEPWVGESPPASLIAGRVMPEAEHVILFHVVLEGSCWVSLPKSDVHVRL